MAFFPYGFSGPVEPHDIGRYRYTVIWLPDDVAAQLPLAAQPRLRVSGEICDHPFAGAWQPVRGRWYLMLGKPLLKATGLVPGAWAELRFRIEDPETVETPALLARAVAASPAAAARWAALTPGRQRALAHRVLAARSAPTVARRVAEAVAWLEAGETDLRRLGQPPSP
jgi:hypothetical protein